MLFDTHDDDSDGANFQPTFVGFVDPDRTFVCVGATTFDDALTTMAVDVDGNYVFVSNAPALAEYMFTGIRYLVPGM